MVSESLITMSSSVHISSVMCVVSSPYKVWVYNRNGKKDICVKLFVVHAGAAQTYYVSVDFIRENDAFNEAHVNLDMPWLTRKEVVRLVYIVLKKRDH